MDSDKRRLTSFELANQRLLVEYEDPADLPKHFITSFDLANQRLLVDYEDPSDLPKTRSTHDALVEELVKECPPVPVGTVQTHGGVTYSYDGEKWISNSAE
jgi:hypothetical protein